VFQLVPIASSPGTGQHWKVPGSVLFAPSHQVFIHVDEIPTAFSPPGWTVPALSAFPHRGHAPVPSPLLWPCAGLSPVCSCLSCTGGPSSGPGTPGVDLPVLSRGEGSHPLSKIRDFLSLSLLGEGVRSCRFSVKVKSALSDSLYLLHALMMSILTCQFQQTKKTIQLLKNCLSLPWKIKCHTTVEQ